MYRFTLKPTGRRASYKLEIDDNQDKSGEASSDGRSLHWSVAPTADETFELANGVRLKDLPGGVSAQIRGTDPKSTTGVDVYPRAGLYVFPDRDKGTQGYTVDLRVSEPLFRRLEQLVITGRVPNLEVDIEETEALTQAGISGRLKWNNKPKDMLAIKSYEFELNLGRIDPEQWSSPEIAPESHGLAPSREADIRELGKTVIKAVELMERTAKKILIPLWIIAALLAYLAVRR